MHFFKYFHVQLTKACKQRVKTYMIILVFIIYVTRENKILSSLMISINSKSVWWKTNHLQYTEKKLWHDGGYTQHNILPWTEANQKWAIHRAFVELFRIACVIYHLILFGIFSMLHSWTGVVISLFSKPESHS